MSNSNIALEALSSDQLSNVAGGGFGWIKPVARFAGKRVLGPFGAAYSGYVGTKKFLDDRRQHKSFGTSLKDGLKTGLF